MKLMKLLGTLIALSIAFFLFSLWKDESNWTLWVGLMIGGTVSHFIIVNLNARQKNKQL